MDLGSFSTEVERWTWGKTAFHQCSRYRNTPISDTYNCKPRFGRGTLLSNLPGVLQNVVILITEGKLVVCGKFSLRSAMIVSFNSADFCRICFNEYLPSLISPFISDFNFRFYLLISMYDCRPAFCLWTYWSYVINAVRAVHFSYLLSKKIFLSYLSTEICQFKTGRCGEQYFKSSKSMMSFTSSLIKQMRPLRLLAGYDYRGHLCHVTRSELHPCYGRRKSLFIDNTRQFEWNVA